MVLKPLFVSGISRSGTSALLASMSLHKNIYRTAKIGEAPFVSGFLNFLVDYENSSPVVEYNLKNYRLDKNERQSLYANMIMKSQCGGDIELEAESDLYWLAKLFLAESAFKKAQEIYSEVRIVHIIRNGIEVVNSARNFTGFENHSFASLCQRWAKSVEHSRYLFTQNLCTVVKHDQLIKKPVETYEKIYRELKISHDDAPAAFIRKNILNSSFDPEMKNIVTTEVLRNRTAAWEIWTTEEKSLFLSICGSYMDELDFVKPYERKIDAVIPSRVPSGKLAQHSSKSQQPAPPTSSIVRAGAQPQYALAPKIQELIKESLSGAHFNYICNVSAKHNYVFVNNPKVASTSILKELQIAEDKQKASEMTNVHLRMDSPLKRLTSFDFETQLNKLESGDQIRFAFVRDPYKRILSAYLSKIAPPIAGWKPDVTRPTHRPPKAEILALINGVDITSIVELKQKVSFEEFVEVLTQQQAVDMDLHWKPQVNILLPDKISYSMVGKLENFTSDFRKMSILINKGDMTLPDYSANRTNSNGQVGNFYSEALKKAIYGKFYDDFNCFEYQKDALKLV